MIIDHLKRHKAFYIIALCAFVAHIGLFLALDYIAVQHPDALHSSFPIAGGGGDSQEYATLGQHILQYGNFSLETGQHAAPETFRTPGYPFFVAFVLALTGSIRAVPFFQILVLLLSGFILYQIGLVLLKGNRTGVLVATGIFFFDPTVFFSTQFVTTETLYICALLASVYFILKPVGSRWVYCAIAGFCFGLSVLIRPSGFLMAAPVAALLVWRLFSEREDRKAVLRQAAAFFILVGLVILPWYVRNEVRTGVFGLSSISAYNTFYFNVPQYFEYHDGTPIEGTRARLNAEAGGLTDAGMRDIRNSALLQKIVVAEMKPHIASYAIFHVSKTANFFMASGLKFDQGFLQGFYGPEESKPWQPSGSIVNSILGHRWNDVGAWIIANALFLPESALLLLACILCLYWAWKSRSASVWLMIGFIAVLALTSGQLSNARYRIPALPFIYLGAVGGAALILDAYNRKHNEY